jgi:hypothetical protein
MSLDGVSNDQRIDGGLARWRMNGGRPKVRVRVRTGRNCRSLRSESVTFLSSVVVCGRKAPKSICQQASPGFPRLRSGQALRLRAIKPSVCNRSAKRFAQDDGFVGGFKSSWLDMQKTRKDRKIHRLGMTKGRVVVPWKVVAGPRVFHHLAWAADLAADQATDP